MILRRLLAGASETRSHDSMPVFIALSRGWEGYKTHSDYMLGPYSPMACVSCINQASEWLVEQYPDEFQMDR